MNFEKDKISSINMGYGSHFEFNGDHFSLPGSFTQHGQGLIDSYFSGKQSLFKTVCGQKESTTELQNFCTHKDILIKNKSILKKINKVNIQSPSYKDDLGQWFLASEKAFRAVNTIPFYSMRMDGWDTHNNQTSRMRKLMKTLDHNIGEYYDNYLSKDIGRNNIFVIYTEFGRTLSANSSGGTEHGRGGLAIVLGHPETVKGGRVFAPDVHNYFEGDFMTQHFYLFDILSNLLKVHMGLSEKALSKVFPNQHLKKDNIKII